MKSFEQKRKEKLERLAREREESQRLAEEARKDAEWQANWGKAAQEQRRAELNEFIDAENARQLQRELEQQRQQRIIDARRAEIHERAKRAATQLAYRSQWSFSWQTFIQHPDIAILPLEEQVRLFRIAQRLHEQRNTTLGSEPPPPPPPVLPAGYNVWFDGSDVATMEFDGSNVNGWNDKVGNMELNVAQYENSNNITQEGRAVRFATNRLSASISGSESVSYGTTGMTLFMVANIHGKDVTQPFANDVTHLWGRQLGVVGVSGTVIGQWALQARSTPVDIYNYNDNSRFRPQFTYQVTSNGGQILAGDVVNTGSLFMTELQVSKSNNNAEVKVITHQGDDSDAKHYGTGYSFMNILGETNDTGATGFPWYLNARPGTAYTSDTSIFHIIQYPKLLTEKETKQVYEFINYYQSTNYQYTSSFL